MAEVLVKKAPAEPAPVMSRLPRSGGDLFDPFYPFALFNTSPWKAMKDFISEFERPFSHLHKYAPEIDWAPAIECKRQNGTYVVTAELPGMKKDDIKVEVADNLLSIEGKREREEVKEEKGFYRSERAYGHFYRYVSLPEGAETEAMKADLKDGVLTVTVPVPEKQEVRRQVPIAS